MEHRVQVGIAELKARLSEYLSRVQAGEELIVADRGRPVARIVPVRWQQTDEEDGRLLDLQRRGVLRLGERVLSERFWTAKRPSDREAGVRAALEDERAEGR
jgi:prevent-host-death family protein